jgi:predicted dehydrogenase
VTLGVGLVGCGDISGVYLVNIPLFADIRCVACADIDARAAARQAARYRLDARSVGDLLASADIDIVLNLTVPQAHAEVTLAALAAGKHVYTEKPLATSVAAGERIVAAAKARGLRVGASPDTVLGAGVQEARAIIDAGRIGKPLTGLAAVLSHGMEHWHPNPGFFFRPGGGPVFDMGPYYLTTLVTLLGPVGSVQALGQIGFAERIVTTPGSAVSGQTIIVETPTSVQALLQFRSGAQVTFFASWDVWRHGAPPIELHGSEGSLRVPDPNGFGGEIEIARGRADWTPIATRDRVFGKPNWPPNRLTEANYRGLGLADMARGIIDERPHRANGEVGLHVLAVMEGILRAAAEGRSVAIAHDCERAEALSETEAAGLLRE